MADCSDHKKPEDNFNEFNGSGHITVPAPDYTVWLAGLHAHGCCTVDPLLDLSPVMNCGSHLASRSVWQEREDFTFKARSTNNKTHI